MVTRHWTTRVPLVRRCLAVAAVATVAGGLVTYAEAVSASPQPTVSQVTAQVKQLTTKENRAIQQYDVVNQQLTAANASLKRIDAQVAKARTEFNTVRTDLAQAAAAAYMDGNLTSMATLLTSANPQAVLSRASMLVQLSSSRYAEMRQFVAAARQLSAAQQQSKRAQQAISALRNQRKAQTDSIAKSLSQKKSLLATLTAQQRVQVVAAATPTGSGAVTTGHDPLPPSGSGANQAVAFAYGALGCPYVYGGTGPCSMGYDCSGLVMAAWASAGVSIPRDTYEQWSALPHIPLSSLQPGDLIYFNGESHVGMYVGGGYIIDAPVPGQSVEKVALSGWYASTEDGAVRP